MLGMRAWKRPETGAGTAMAQNKPYADYRFIGVKPFTKMLEDAGVAYTLFNDAAIDRLFAEKAEYFNRAEDTICVGRSSQERAEVFFAEFGLKITPSYRSYIVFIFDHHPTEEDMLITADDIEPLIAKSLENVDPGDILRH
jgi:hypothetical protein